MGVVENAERHHLLREAMSVLQSVQQNPHGLFAENLLLVEVCTVAEQMLSVRPAKVGFNLLVGSNGMIQRVKEEDAELDEAMSTPFYAAREAVDVYWFAAMAEVHRILEGRPRGQIFSYAQSCLAKIDQLAASHSGYDPRPHINPKLETNKTNYPRSMYAVRDDWDLGMMYGSASLADNKLKKLRQKWEDRILPTEVSKALNERRESIPTMFVWVTGAPEAYAEAYDVIRDIWG